MSQSFGVYPAYRGQTSVVGCQSLRGAGEKQISLVRWVLSLKFPCLSLDAFCFFFFASALLFWYLNSYFDTLLVFVVRCFVAVSIKAKMIFLYFPLLGPGMLLLLLCFVLLGYTFHISLLFPSFDRMCFLLGCLRLFFFLLFLDVPPLL